MASTFTVSPSALHDHNHVPNKSEQLHPSSSNTHLSLANTPNHQDLSPLLSQGDFEHLSPQTGATFDLSDTSTTTPNQLHVDDFGDDPFFGANFNIEEGDSPSFLNDSPAAWDQGIAAPSQSFASVSQRNASTDSYPLTPEQTASLHTSTPRSEFRAAAIGSGQIVSTSVSPEELQKPFPHPTLNTQSSQLTPDQSSSYQSSEDGIASATANMHPHSPRVLVSVWDRDADSPTHALERGFDDEAPTTRSGLESAGDLISSLEPKNHHPEQWHRDVGLQRSGLNPDQRPTVEIPSINEVIKQRDTDERNREVDQWVKKDLDTTSFPTENSPEEIQSIDRPGRDSNDNIPLGNQTENKYVDGQTYYDPTSGCMSPEDYSIIASDRVWQNAPVLHQIQQASPGQHQPETSQQAIERWNKIQQDNMSILSRAATWGTRRRSLPSLLESDVEGVTSGSFLKKLSLSKGSGDSKGSKPNSFFQELRGLVRRPSTNAVTNAVLKRSRSRSNSRSSPQQSPVLGDEAKAQAQPLQRGRGDSSPLLSLPTRSDSGSKKQAPSINTALVSIGHNVASIGATHTRKGSVSSTMVATSPRSAGSTLTVRNTLRKRSKSEAPKPTAPPPLDTHQNLVGLWKATGGPPVASIGNKPCVEFEDDEDEDDGPFDNEVTDTEVNLIDGTAPTFAGFMTHVQQLNPSLIGTAPYLADRIAHHQVIRYKQLLTSAVKHLQAGPQCACGTLCKAQGGTAILLDSKGDARGIDPLASHMPDDDEGGLTEGAINQDSFPQDIPMPPTRYLPAEFECQLCYEKKKFQKPSDWTKHVHEDVAPFTCTWDKCRDIKLFKRKADWVRHENEGHRHLEWWTCDFPDCAHKCYRRDNFLQHLVREHKYPEPKIKTKAAMKKAGGGDPTWQKVEQCHVETSKRPQEEPCRFCGKTFPTWKKLTVHLAKHMEQISLPVLRLVAVKAKEIDADTIISPVQDPPQRFNMSAIDSSPYAQYPEAFPQTLPLGATHGAFQNVGAPMMNTNTVVTGPFDQPYMPATTPIQYGNQQQHLDHTAQLGGMGQGFGQTGQLQNLSATPSPYLSNQHGFVPMQSFHQVNGLGLQNLGAGQLGGQLNGQVGFNGMIDPRSGNGSPFSGQGSISPYQQSPHVGGTDNGERGWDDRHQSGFM